MNILIVNTSEMTGGAAIAAHRLMDALNTRGDVEARMLVRDKTTENPLVAATGHPLAEKCHFLRERLSIFTHMRFSRSHLFEVDIANAGTDITSHPLFRWADVIHLHWINQGMLSLHDIERIVRSGKPVVWTMHDFWPATGICHYPRLCSAYTTECAGCQYLPRGGSPYDLSNHVWRKKHDVWANSDITFVTCSRWLADKAHQSALLHGLSVTSIPNPIDTTVFRPTDRNTARNALSLPIDKRLLLFVSQRITDKRKGMDYLIDACRKLAADDPSCVNNTALVVLGGASNEVADKLPFDVYPMGYVSDTEKIISIYNAVDAYVLPSLEDNLPNTIMEAMACGVPSVGFCSGGIPEMIDHRLNGYVATYKDVDDLARGIAYVLDPTHHHLLSTNAITKVASTYAQPIVAQLYYDIYTSKLNPHQ